MRDNVCLFLYITGKVMRYGSMTDTYEVLYEDQDTEVLSLNLHPKP